MARTNYVGLFRQREFRALWTGNALAVAATTMSSLTLGTLVYAQTGSAFLTAVAMFGPSLIQVVGASTLMSAADTARPRPLLVALAAAMALTLAAQALFELAPASRLVIVLAAAYLLSIGSGARWGLLSQILPADDYALGRSAMNVSVGVMQIVGFATGGLLLHVLSVSQIFWLAAALAALAVPITWAGSAPTRPDGPGEPESGRRGWATRGSSGCRRRGPWWSPCASRTGWWPDAKRCSCRMPATKLPRCSWPLRWACSPATWLSAACSLRAAGVPPRGGCASWWRRRFWRSSGSRAFRSRRC